MKKTILYILVLITFQCFSQSSNTKKRFVPTPKGMSFVPMGSFITGNDTLKKTVSVDAFWISNEITNKEYREFISDLKNNPKDSLVIIDYNKMKETSNIDEEKTYFIYKEILTHAIDQTVWQNDAKYKNYFTDKKYDDYPVVGVSYQGAVLYCAWKTKEENELRKNKGLGFIQDYRLPCKFEWEYAALGSMKEPQAIEKDNEINKSKSGKKNNYGLYNFYGNVSEWTTNNKNENYILKGASWKNERKLDECIVVKSDFKDNATGFRIVISYLANK